MWLRRYSFFRLNAPGPPAFRKSVRYGEQDLYSQAESLVGDRDPRSHEFSVQLRAMDTDRSGHWRKINLFSARRDPAPEIA